MVFGGYTMLLSMLDEFAAFLAHFHLGCRHVTRWPVCGRQVCTQCGRSRQARMTKTGFVYGPWRVLPPVPVSAVPGAKLIERFR